jgi:hypothetical protein
MSCIDEIFFEHPRNVNMSYSKHFCFSCMLSVSFCCASLQACIHGFIPYFFQTSSTDYSKSISSIIDNTHNK